MKISLNELHVKCRNVFRGLGFPPGSDEEAAYIIGWLEIHRLDGLKQFPDICACLKKNAFPSSVGFSGIGAIDCSQYCAIAVVPGAFDYLRSKDTDSQTCELVIDRCSDATLFLPLIMKYMDSKHSWVVDGADGQSKTQIFADVGNEQLYVASSKQETAGSSSQIRIKRINPLSSNSRNSSEGQSFASLHEREHHAIENGLEVEDTQWQFVLGMARKYLVPASAESRKKGAGGGDSND